MNIYDLPNGMSEALEEYYSCFDENGELIAEESVMEAAEQKLASFESDAEKTIEYYLNERANRILRLEAIGKEIERLTWMAARENKRAERIKMLVDRGFQSCYAGKPKAYGNFTLSYIQSKQTVITDVSKIPAEYMSVPKTPAPQPNKTEIKKAIESGKEIPGAKVETKQNLQIN